MGSKLCCLGDSPTSEGAGTKEAEGEEQGSPGRQEENELTEEEIEVLSEPTFGFLRVFQQ